MEPCFLHQEPTMSRQKSRSAPKKPKLVRDSFTIPKSEYAAVDALKSRAVALGTAVKKSELLRAGLKLLTGLSDGAYLDALSAIPTLKTGRPRSEKPKDPAAKRVTRSASSQPVKKAAVRKPSRPSAPEPTKPISPAPATSPAPRPTPRKAAATKKQSAPRPTATPRKTAVRKSAPKSAATSA
jgi:hypothetical protein